MRCEQGGIFVVFVRPDTVIAEYGNLRYNQYIPM